MTESNVTYLPWAGDISIFQERNAERDARIDELVLARLSRSSLSVAEVSFVLKEHGLDQSEISEWISRYMRLGYLDDHQLATQIVHTSTRNQGRGSAVIRAQLKSRGIDSGIADQALSDLDDDYEQESALAIAERRARQLAGLDRAVAERRLSAFLVRRGYPGHIVSKAVSSALRA